MSPSWPSLLPGARIALLPGRAALAVGEAVRRADGVLPSPPGGGDGGEGNGWAGALAALDGLLTEAKARGNPTVTLSHHFPRLFLLPPPATWLRPAEMAPWLKDSLKDALADDIDWHYTWQPAPPGRPILVAALPQTQLTQLRQTLARHGLAPGAVRPWLAAAWARRHRRLGRASGWYALLEPGQIVLLGLRRGQPSVLRQRQIHDGAGADLHALLTRETLLAGADPGGQVWLERAGVNLDRAALAGVYRLDELAGPQDPVGALLA